MKKIVLTAFIAGLSVLALESNAQSGTYRDDQGEYHYETREERVWVPEQRTGGIFGVGGRTVPGHYETQSRQVKVYHDQNGNPVNANGQYGTQGKGWEGKHPHGMPPGQRKKQGNANYDNRNGTYDRNGDGRIDERDRNYDNRNGSYDRNGDGRIDERDRSYDRNGDGVVDSRDRVGTDRNGDGKIDNRDRYDSNGDGVIDTRDRGTYDRNGDRDRNYQGGRNYDQKKDKKGKGYKGNK